MVLRKFCTKLCTFNRIIFLNDLRMAPFLPTGSLERRIARNAVSLTSICFTHVIRTVTSSVVAITSGTVSYKYHVYDSFVLIRLMIWSIEVTAEAVSVSETRDIFLATLRQVFQIEGSWIFTYWHIFC